MANRRISGLVRDVLHVRTFQQPESSDSDSDSDSLELSESDDESLLQIEQHLEALLAGLQAEGEALQVQYYRELERVPAEPPQFDKVRCPKFHALTYHKRRRNGWACDTRRQFRDDRSTKARYGLSEGEPWACLSGCTDYDQMNGVPVYHCSKCDFDLCFRCYARAKKGLQRMKALSATLNATDRVAWMQSKLMVVGEGRAGKTSTVRTLLGEPFVHDLDSTVGANLTYAKSNPKESWSEVQEGQQAGHAIAAAVKQMKQSNGKVTPGNRQGVSSFGKAARKLRQTRVKPVKMPRRKRRATRNSGREEEQEEGKEEGQTQNEKNNAKEEKPSAVMDMAEVAGKFKMDLLSDSLEELERIKFTIWDYGGQSVFYSLHHLFLTRYGIYLVVFNVATFLSDQDTAMEFLRFWMHSIRLHAKDAPIIIIGTHADAISEDRAAAESIEKVLNAELQKFSQIRRNKQHGLTFFGLDNRTSAGISVIRAEIEAASQKQTFLHYKVSIRWLRCLDMLTADQEVAKVSLTQAREIAKEAGVTTSREVAEMLGLFHELGVIIHFTSTVALEKLIVTNPQWLIDELGKVIRDKTIHKVNVDEIKQAGLLSDLDALHSNGIASLDLLQFFWGREATDFFVDLMLRTLLMSDWPYVSQQDKSFLIPSLLPERRLDHTEPCASCKLCFSEDFLPDGYFERLVCLSLGFSGRHYTANQPTIGKSFAKFCLAGEKDVVYLERVGAEILLENTQESLSVKDLSIIQSIMRKINSDVMGSGLKWRVLYRDKQTNKYVEEEQAKEMRLAPWFGETKPGAQATTAETSTDRLDAFMDLVSSGQVL